MTRLSVHDPTTTVNVPSVLGLRAAMLTLPVSPRAISNQHQSHIALGLHGKSHIFHEHSALVAAPVSMAQSRYQPSRVHFEQRFWLLIWIDFDILVIELFELKRDPDTLYEWTIKQFAVSTNGCHRRLSCFSSISDRVAEPVDEEMMKSSPETATEQLQVMVFFMLLGRL